MQSAIIELLSHPTTYGPEVDHVALMETHISHIFLAGPKAYKLKRAVALPYLDFSTLEAREQACQNEVKLNQRTAPEIYLGIKPVTKGPGGELAIDGEGEVVDWLVEMNRFEQESLLSTMAKSNHLSLHDMELLAEKIFEFHRHEPAAQVAGGAERIASIIENNGQCFEEYGAGIFDDTKIEELNDRLQRNLKQNISLLERRKAQGRVRHCHGDLHLGNIVMIDEEPVLFDAIEFSDDLATIDVMYDLAFLIMDLVFQDMVTEANWLLNRYLMLSGDVEALAVLPLFMSMRASIRAHVAALAKAESEAIKYLDLAIGCLEPTAPRLIVIGGLSGTGKTSLARALAPTILPLPGALILRSDVIRKHLAEIGQYETLPDEGYSAEMTQKTYRQIYRDAATALAAGHSVIADAVFAGPEERAAIAEVAKHAGIAFDGIWLDLDPAAAEARISNRTKDASDATVAILKQQLAYDVGMIDWHRIPSEGELEAVQTAAFSALLAD